MSNTTAVYSGSCDVIGCEQPATLCKLIVNRPYLCGQHWPRAAFGDMEHAQVRTATEVRMEKNMKYADLAGDAVGQSAEDAAKVHYNDVLKKNQTAATERLGLGTRFVPGSSIERIGAIFLEGIPKYGLDNWKKGVFNPLWKAERWEHMNRHAKRVSDRQLGIPIVYGPGEGPEDDLAKVGWYAVAMMWIEDEEKRQMGEKTAADCRNVKNNQPSYPSATSLRDAIAKTATQVDHERDRT